MLRIGWLLLAFEVIKRVMMRVLMLIVMLVTMVVMLLCACRTFPERGRSAWTALVKRGSATMGRSIPPGSVKMSKMSLPSSSFPRDQGSYGDVSCTQRAGTIFRGT